MGYKLRIYDNYHYMMEEEASDHGEYATATEAIEAAKKIIMEFFCNGQSKDKPLDEAKPMWVHYGEDPVILAIGNSPAVEFSARKFVEGLTEEDVRKNRVI